MDYESTISALQDNLQTRNNSLTFSFTTVLALLGIAFANQDKNLPLILYLIPFFLLIPFSARMTYHRTIHARLSAFLLVYYPEKTKWNTYGDEIKEKRNILITFLVQYELFILGFACVLLYYLQYPYPTSLINIDVHIAFELIIPLVPLALLFYIIHYATDYNKHLKEYKAGWTKQKERLNAEEKKINTP